MKNQILFTLSLLLFCSTFSFAQDYDLNSYDFRYQKYRGLTLDFDLGNDGRQTFNSTQDTFFADSSFVNTGRSSTAFNFSPRYFSFVNTDALQRTVDARFGSIFSLDFDNEKSSFNERRKNSDSEMDLDISYQNTSRFYSNNKFKYFKVNASSRFETDKSMRNISGELDAESSLKNFNNRLSVSYGFGTGRLNDVRDAVQAMFILQDLKSVTGETYSNQQIEGIAQGITQIRNARYLDFRIRYKTQIRMLDSVLQANGVGGENTIDYFSIISDNWLYANRASRSSGKRWTHYISAVHEYSQGTFDNKNNLTSTNPNHYARQISFLLPRMNLNTEFSYSTQRSLHVQNSFSIVASSGLGYDKIGNFEVYSIEPINRDTFDKFNANESVSWTTALRGNYSYLYQPNTRNIFRLSVNSSVSYLRWLPEYSANQFAESRSTFSPDFRANSDYYHWFSPHLNIRASANLGANLRYTKQEDEFVFNKEQSTGLYYGFNVGLNYQLF